MERKKSSYFRKKGNKSMPIPSASSKIIFTTFKFFWACSLFFEHSQIFWSWSKARFYLINLHIWAWSKIFEHIQKILNTVKNIWTWSKNIWTSKWIRHKTFFPISRLYIPTVTLFSKIKSNYWQTFSLCVQKIQQFPSSISIFGQKSWFLGPSQLFM